jgi:hypothetical protein
MLVRAHGNVDAIICANVKETQTLIAFVALSGEGGLRATRQSTKYSSDQKEGRYVGAH